MKKSGGNKINNALDYKNVVLVLLAFITFVFCAITGVKYERLSRVGKQNVLDADDRIGEKTKTENPDGTTTISLTVKNSFIIKQF